MATSTQVVPTTFKKGDKVQITGGEKKNRKGVVQSIGQHELLRGWATIKLVYNPYSVKMDMLRDRHRGINEEDNTYLVGVEISNLVKI